MDDVERAGEVDGHEHVPALGREPVQQKQSGRVRASSNHDDVNRTRRNQAPRRTHQPPHGSTTSSSWPTMPSPSTSCGRPAACTWRPGADGTLARIAAPIPLDAPITTATRPLQRVRSTTMCTPSTSKEHLHLVSGHPTRRAKVRRTLLERSHPQQVPERGAEPSASHSRACSKSPIVYAWRTSITICWRTMVWKEGVRGIREEPVHATGLQGGTRSTAVARVASAPTASRTRMNPRPPRPRPVPRRRRHAPDGRRAHAPARAALSSAPMTATVGISFSRAAWSVTSPIVPAPIEHSRARRKAGRSQRKQHKHKSPAARSARRRGRRGRRAAPAGNRPARAPDRRTPRRGRRRSGCPSGQGSSWPARHRTRFPRPANRLTAARCRSTAQHRCQRRNLTHEFVAHHQRRSAISHVAEVPLNLGPADPDRAW